jgi:hypothetical protein
MDRTKTIPPFFNPRSRKMEKLTRNYVLVEDSL